MITRIPVVTVGCNMDNTFIYTPSSLHYNFFCQKEILKKRRVTQNIFSFPFSLIYISMCIWCLSVHIYLVYNESYLLYKEVYHHTLIISFFFISPYSQKNHIFRRENNPLLTQHINHLKRSHYTLYPYIYFYYLFVLCAR